MHTDGVRIGARLQHEIVFQLVLLPVIDHVDPRVDIPVADAGVSGNTHLPFLTRAYQVIRPGGQPVLRLNPRRSIGTRQVQGDPLGMAKDQGGALRRQRQRVAGGARAAKRTEESNWPWLASKRRGN